MIRSPSSLRSARAIGSSGARLPAIPTAGTPYIECLSNIQHVNGRPTQLTAADPRYVDYYGRPWAQDWEKYFEVGWEKPQTELPQEIVDLFK